ncbi:MAG: DNA polymerase IV [Candidatus Komeilibacteria bacterium]
MWNQRLSSWPRAIVHLDADAFFASCEQALHPEYRGKPVITGGERGIAASMSYEAKRLGVKRAMSLLEIKKMIPGVIILPSDYETYSLFSKRMFAVMRRYTAMVEEYSIDEAFADITGLRRPLRLTYEQIARRMKDEIQNELGITVSVGLSVNKVLSKLAANLHKPDCFEVISTKHIDGKVHNVPVEDIWGVGPQTTEHLHNLGIWTVGQLRSKSELFIQNNFTKPHQEIWLELQGLQVYEVEPEEKSSYYSISKTKTFTPASSDREFVFAQLVKNLENACIKARRYNLVASKLFILLRTQEFKHYGLEAKLSRATHYPEDIIDLARKLFDQLFVAGTRYRLTGVVLGELMPRASIQTNLFEPPVRLDKLKKIYSAVDHLADKYGKHTVYLAAAHKAYTTKTHQGGRGGESERQQHKLKGETKRQHLNLRLLSYDVK